MLYTIVRYETFVRNAHKNDDADDDDGDNNNCFDMNSLNDIQLFYLLNHFVDMCICVYICVCGLFCVSYKLRLKRLHTHTRDSLNR